jgi:hypothetical protein
MLRPQTRNSVYEVINANPNDSNLGRPLTLFRSHVGASLCVDSVRFYELINAKSLRRRLDFRIEFFKKSEL